MAITNAQQARQLYDNGGDVLGPLGENNLINQLSPGKIGKGLAFILSGGLSGGVSAVAEELAKQKILDQITKKTGDAIRPKIQTKLIQQDNRAQGIGGYQSDFAQDSGFMGGKGTAAEMGSFAVGGLADGNFDFDSARQMYGLGKLVKKVTRSVKKIAKSPIGKAALLYTVGGGLGSMAGGQGFFSNFMSPMNQIKGIGSIFSKSGLQNIGSKIGFGSFENVGGNRIFQKNFLGKALTSPTGLITAASTVAGLLTPEQEEEAQVLSTEEGIDIEAARNQILAARQDDFRARAFRAEGGSMDEPVAKKTMPLLDMDGKEMDLRAEGGFVPIGRMEKADDVPARLSKNEFVFTADAVRNAGEGDVDKGAEVMYNMMKNLESGGEVSEESQGLEGARKMFQTSQRLEEVL